MNSQFLYDCNEFLTTVKYYCKSKTKVFIETENQNDIPKDLEPLIAEFTNFNAKYGKSLEALSDHPNIFF